MTTFDSDDAYWRFARAVVCTARYVRDAASDRFLATLLSQGAAHVELVEPGMVLWRAALGHGWMDERHEGDTFQVPTPHPPDRMRPLPDRAKEGRANPKGIPYLYLATHRDTALAEVRPWIGSSISVAQFKALRRLRVVNCTEHSKRSRRLIGETPPELWDSNVWSDVDDAFSQPVGLSDDNADYAPTQVIAECFKSGGYDGVAYASALGQGHNIVVFDVAAASLVGCGLYELKRLDFGFEQSVNPYAVVQKADRTNRRTEVHDD